MDDWSNDASFDPVSIDNSLALLPRAGGSSGSSASASSSGHGNAKAGPSSRPRGHRSSSSFSSRSSTSSVGQSPVSVNSPLRHSFTHGSPPACKLEHAKRSTEKVEEEVDFDDGFDDAFGDSEPITRAPLSLDAGKLHGLPGVTGTVKSLGGVRSGSGAMLGVMASGTVIGTGPKGIGTITRLGSGSSASSLPSSSKPSDTASVKARAKAWEADLGLDGDNDGFGDAGFGTGPRGSAGAGSVKGGTIKLKTPSNNSTTTVNGNSGPALQLKLPNRPLPPPEDLDDLGFDLDDAEADAVFGRSGLGTKDDEATLKAGNTLKAMLPPPRPKSTPAAGGSSKMGHIPFPLPTTGSTADKGGAKAAGGKEDDGGEGDFDLEADIVLPLNLTNLVLATKSHPTARNHAPPSNALLGKGEGGKGPRRSDASDTFGSISTGTNEWDVEPSTKKQDKGSDHATPSSSSRSRLAHASTSTSVSDRLKYYSETSATSIDEPAELSSPSPSATYRHRPDQGDTIKASALAKGAIRPTGVLGAPEAGWEEDELELDMESGLVLPDPSFFSFSAQRSKELNGILDRKRKQHYAPAPDVAAASAATNSGAGGAKGRMAVTSGLFDVHGEEGGKRKDENMEDGFVFDNPRVELSNTRLRTQRRMRGGEAVVPLNAGQSGTAGGKGNRRDREGPGLRSIARSKEAGWRHQVSSRGGAESPFSSAAAGGANSSSSGSAPSLPTASSRDASNPTPTPNRHVAVGSTRTRTQSAMHQGGGGGVSSMFANTPSASAAGGAGTVTPGRLRYQKSHANISSVRGTGGLGGIGRSTSPTPVSQGGSGSAANTLLRKQSLASLQDAMKRTGTPSSSPSPFVLGAGTLKSASAFASIPSQAPPGASSGGIDGLPSSSTRESLVSTPNRERDRDRDRERYHASTSRLTMPTSSSRAKARPPIAGVFSRSGLGGADSPGPAGSGLLPLAESDPIQSRRISPPRNAHLGPAAAGVAALVPSRANPSARRLIEPTQLLVPLSKRKQQEQQHQQQQQQQRANAATTGSFGRKARQWGDGSELEGIEDLVVDDDAKSSAKGSLGRNSGRNAGGSVGRAGGIGLGRPSVPRKDSHNDPTTHAGRPTTGHADDKEKRHKSRTRGDADKPSVAASAQTGTNASNTGSGSRRKTKRPAMLIKHLGGVDKRKVVGEMTWNPHSLRWEGNESILASFDPPSISPNNSRSPSKAGTTRPGARPALITHLTPGSIGMSSLDPHSRSSTAASASSALDGAISSKAGLTAITSPEKDRYSTIRIVGDMQFDPQKMCWVSLVPEEDAFEGMADDEDDEWGFGSVGVLGAGGTIRGSKGLVSVGGHHQQGGRMASTSTANTDWTQGTTGTQISLATVGSGSTFWASTPGLGGGAGRGPRESFGGMSEGSNTSPGKHSTASTSGFSGVQGGEELGRWQAAISPELWAECQAAEERHRKEVRGWCVRPIPPPPSATAAAATATGTGSGGRAAQAAQAQWVKDVQDRERREGKRLWEIRNLAMRS